jgi:hypothetical protein
VAETKAEQDSRPESLSVRLLVPDPRRPWTLPARADDLSDSPAFRTRAAPIMEQHTLAAVVRSTSHAPRFAPTVRGIEPLTSALQTPYRSVNQCQI